MTNQPIVELANREIAYLGAVSGIAVAGLLEAIITEPERKPLGLRRLADYLDRTDYGYGLGLHLAIIASIGAICGLWWLAIPLATAAFALCWWFG